MTPQPQTVEDLGKLVKSKYPGTYDSLSNIDVGTKVKTKYPDAYGQFVDVKSKTETSKDTRSTLGKVGDFFNKFNLADPKNADTLKGQVYDPTIGSIGQGARDIITPGSRLKGAHEIISGAENTALPLAAAAAITNPEVTLPAMALGAAGQYAGKYIPKALGASEDVSNLTGDIAGLAAGGMGAKGGPRISSAVKVAAPDVAIGAGKAAVGAGVGYAAHEAGAPGYMSYMLGYGPAKSGLRQMGEGLVAGAKELVGKGVKPQETVSPLKANIAPGPVESPKTLNIGQLERLVKIGRIEPEEFNNRLITELKYKPQDAEHLTELLKKSIEDEENEEEKSNSKVDHPAKSKANKLNKLFKEGDKPEKPVQPSETTKPAPGMVRLYRGQPKDYQTDVSKIGETGRPGTQFTTDKEFAELYSRGKPLLHVDVPEHVVNSPEALQRPGTVTNEVWNNQSGRILPAEYANQAKRLGEVNPPDAVETFTTEAPPKEPITQHQIEESQSTPRAAKETTLARHYADKDKFPELPDMKVSSEYLRAVGKEAGLEREPSLRTHENAVIRARELRELN